jgi:hypothetical protein
VRPPRGAQQLQLQASTSSVAVHVLVQVRRDRSAI